MNRRRADAVVGLLVGGILLVGGGLTWQAFQQRRAAGQMMAMMDSSMGTVHGTNPLWYALGTLILAAAVGGLYLAVRPDLPVDESRARPNTDAAPVAPTEATDPVTEPAVDPATQSQRRVLDLLPEDERRVLEPVITSPGITQIELRDRAEFSKSKVSQTVSDLEKRGLLTRERQGRTYRVYPSDDLVETES